MSLHKILYYYEMEKRKELRHYKMLSIIHKASQTIPASNEASARRQKQAYEEFLNALDPDFKQKAEDIIDFTDTEYLEDE